MCPPDRKDVLLFDADLRGFGLRVGVNGNKTFIAQYRSPAGVRRMVLGAFGTLTVKEARKRAKAVLGDVAKGQDPFAERKAAVAAQKAAAAVDAFTVRALVDAWQAAREGDRRASYLSVASGSLRRHFAAWLDRPAASITVAEAVLALDRIKAGAGPTAANRALAYGRAAFGWACKRHTLASNPFHRLEAPSRERARDRVLSAEEIGAIWQAVDGLTAPYGPFVRVLMLTLQRREEVAALRWDELSADLTTWTLPAERAKNGRAHVVHLPEPVRAILGALPRRRDCPFVFPADSGRPISAFSAAKRKLDAAITAKRDEAGIEPPALPAWTLHDFRRAGVTELAGMGFAPHICDRLLNHVSGAIRGVAAVYQKAEFLAERKAALEAWAKHVLAAAEARPAGGNVVQFRGGSDVA